LVSDVVKEFDVQAVVAKAVLHDRGHGIKESLDAVFGFEIATGFLEGSSISVHHLYPR
jgi:HD superfamily phosphodiesterase